MTEILFLRGGSVESNSSDMRILKRCEDYRTEKSSYDKRRKKPSAEIQVHA